MSRIVIDTKEQTPWHFTYPTVYKHLDTGDYSIEGRENLICVERKSLNDLVNTVIHDWLRFSKECRRMSAMNHAYIVVEDSVSNLIGGAYESEALPQSVRGKLNTIFLRFGVPTIFLDNPVTAGEWVENIFTLYLDGNNV